VVETSSPAGRGQGWVSKFKIQGSKLDVGCWLLVVGCWMLQAVPLLGGVRGGFRVQGSMFDVDISSPPGRGRGWVAWSFRSVPPLISHLLSPHSVFRIPHLDVQRTAHSRPRLL